MVTVVFLMAYLPQLFGTSSAAFTAVHDQTDTWWAGGGSFRALARPLAVLSAVVRLRHIKHFRGILGKSLLNLEDSTDSALKKIHCMHFQEQITSTGWQYFIRYNVS